MVVQHNNAPFTRGSSTFDPETFFASWEGSRGETIADHDLAGFTKKVFGLPEDDNYVYHAVASVTLTQVQQAIRHGASYGLHAWYLDPDGKQIPNPSQTDITAYTSIFSPTTTTTKALTAFASNAKKSSIRASVALHLIRRRIISQGCNIPRNRNHVNPYLDVWRWSCHNLEWAGPDEESVNVKQSHHILPVLYHHYGCICPSFEALQIVKQYAQDRTVFDIGSGNGYWTIMLRRMGLQVTAVDNGDSLWRTMWIGDTIIMDGARFLNQNDNGLNAVLLLVYPQISGDFTKKMLAAYRGETVCVVGTQNQNGFTAFGDTTVDEYFKRSMKAWTKVIQTPLPSFAGKDEALYVFCKLSS